MESCRDRMENPIADSFNDAQQKIYQIQKELGVFIPDPSYPGSRPKKFYVRPGHEKFNSSNESVDVDIKYKYPRDYRKLE